jgi:TonB-dependent receptor
MSTITFAPAWLRALALTLAVAFPLATYGQATGSVTGTVVSSINGNYLEGAEISIDALNLRTNSGRGGLFQLSGVPAGRHEVTVNYPGLNSFTTTVEVSAGASTPMIARLESDVYTLETFKVQGSKEGMSQAVALQRISVQTKMVAAADQFGEISEGNIGEYLKFMPGVSIDYNVNDARGISLRGLSTAFTVVAVDGTPMAGASSVDDTRRFEFEQIAMNNVETTELFKTVTPDIPANATGGFVNFVTKSAFDHEEQQRITYNFSFTAPSSNFSLGRESGVWGSDREFVVRPSAELNYSRKVTEKLGVNVNYRFSERYDDSPRTEYTWNPATTGQTRLTGNPRLQQYNIRDEQKLTQRQAFATKVDYKLTDRTSIMVAGQWNWYDLHFTQRGPQFVLGTASTVSGGTHTSGTGANVNNNVLYRNKYGTTWHFNGALNHDFGNGGKLAFSPYWSRADGYYRDTNKGFISSVAQLNPALYSNFSLSNVMDLGTLPNINLMLAGNPVPMDVARNLANYRLSNTLTGGNLQSRPWTAIDEKDGFRADYSQELGTALPLTLSTGVALDNTQRSIHRPDIRYQLATTANPVTGSAITPLLDTGYTGDVAYGYGSYQSVNPFLVWDLVRNNPSHVVSVQQRDFDEKNQAAYLRGDLKITDNFLLVGGVRWEKREITAAARNEAPPAPPALPTNDRSRYTRVNLDYDELYPSLSFKYTPRRNIVLRGGVSRTVGHPDYSDLLPVFTAESSLGAGDGALTVPDPNLEPYFSVNYDLSVDYYLRNSGVIGIYAFRKDVKNYFISRGMTGPERTAIATAYGFNPAEFSTGTVRENGGKSTLQGIELSYAQNLSMLPAPLNGLSIQANFTFLDVESKDSDPLVALDTYYSQMRAVSPKTANLVIGYRYKDWRLTLTNNWVDESLYGGFVATAFFNGTANTANQALDTRMTLNKDEKLTTDLKVEYAFSKRFAAYFLVRNMFNTPRKEFMRGYLPQYQDVVLPLRYFEFGEPHYTLGFRGTF